jgi:hypothetical protein
VTGADRPRLIRRLISKLRRYTVDVQQSRDELAESTQEQALPPIPPGDRHPPTA